MNATETAPRRYLRTADLRQLLPYARTAFYEVIKQSGFPVPLQLTEGGDYLWVAAEIDEWLDSRPRVTFRSKAVRRQTSPEQEELELELRPVTGRRGAA